MIQLLLENGALCERDTFQGERCLYNALNDRIRNLLLSYDYAKSSNPLQPLAAHITSLLTRPEPKTADITITTYDETFNLHKFLLAARSPYFAKKLGAAPNTATWKLPDKIPTQSLTVAMQYLYFSEVSMRRVVHGLNEEEEMHVLNGIDKIGRQLEMDRLFEDITEVSDRRLLRQKRAEELDRGRDQLEAWFKENVLRNKLEIDTAKVDDLKWDRDNSIYADILLRADDDDDEEYELEAADASSGLARSSTPSTSNVLGIPHQSQPQSRSPSRSRKARKSTIYPAHKAMLLRSEYFSTMLTSPFRSTLR